MAEVNQKSIMRYVLKMQSFQTGKEEKHLVDLHMVNMFVRVLLTKETFVNPRNLKL